MKNTGIIYHSTERQPTVLPEMAELLPPLTQEQLSALEADLLANGCYSPLVVNQDMVIVDGHNRQSICEKHNIPYRMTVFEFTDPLEAKQWALDAQKGRRNLDKWELGKIAMKLKTEVEARARANQSAAGGGKSSEALRQTFNETSLKHVDTRQQLADSVGITRDAMNKVMKIDAEAPRAVKKALDHKTISLNQAYNITRQVQAVPEEEREEAARIAVMMEKAKTVIQEKDEESNRKCKTARQFSKTIIMSHRVKATEEDVSCWVESCRMTPMEIDHNIRECSEMAEKFQSIAEILRTKLPEGYRSEFADLFKDEMEDYPEAEGASE